MGTLYTVLLSKNLGLNDEHTTEKWIKHNYTRWVSLGHFDDIYVYSDTTNRDLLDKIRESKDDVFLHNNEQIYYHPLHLVPVENKSSFVNNDEYSFIAIVRIHFPNSTDLKKEFEILGEKLTSSFGTPSLSYQMFYATELSDMVLDIRSNRLDLLTKAVFNLYKKDEKSKTIKFGKTYTYFGINYEHLKNNRINSTYSPDNYDILEMFTIRFSRQDKIAEKQIGLITDTIRDVNGQVQKYRINGIDDIMLICSNCPTRALVAVYRNLLFNDEYIEFQKAESSSRIGVTFNFESFYEADLNTNLKNSKICSELPKLCTSISDKLRIDKEHFGWFYTVSEVANSLVRMSATPVMDEVVYLLAPAVHAFLVDVDKNISNGCDMYYESLYRFAELCSYYIEQLMRIEGQLSHNPEIRPVIYNIPLFMIEYTIAFLNKVSVLLTHDDNPKTNPTIFLLVPKPCEFIGATELFSATTNKYGLVYIEIPERMLYNPKELFQILCHENSHYVGEYYRNREFRKKVFSRAAASLLISCLFNTDEKHLLELIKEKFINGIDEITTLTIREMSYKILELTENLLFQEGCFDKFVLEYFSYTTKNKSCPINLKGFEEEYVRILFENEFAQRLFDLEILFREIYADICMMYILNMNQDEYIESLLKELSLNHTEGSYSYDMFAIRIYVTLYSSGCDDIIYCGTEYRSVWEKLEIIINQIKKELDEKYDDNYILYIPITAIYELIEYSKKCYKYMSSSLTVDDVSNVSNMYRDLSNKERFTLKNILDEIQDSREEILNAYSETDNDS